MAYEFEKNKLYSILGKSLVENLKCCHAYIAGGTITSLFCNREYNDIDIYFRDRILAGEFIKCELIEIEDIISLNHTTLSRAKVIREVPIEEYQNSSLDF
jgi:hypothetical protein